MRWHQFSLIVLVFAAGPLMAQPDKMLLELCVNGSSFGTAFVLVREGHFLVDEEAVKRTSLPLQGAPQQTIAGRRFVDVSAYDRAGKVEFDERGGRLLLTMPARVFDRHRIELNPRPPQLKPTAVPSAFVNYALGAGTVYGSDSVYMDMGFAYGQGLLRDNPSWNENQGLTRGLTRFEYDDFDHTRRWIVGDQYAFSSDGLGGAALLGGIGLVRAFDLDPYLTTFPQPTFSGLLQAPGTINVYENGVLVAQRQVPAGAFNLASLGLGAGANNVRVVVQDPFGGTTVLQHNFYVPSQMLAQGLSDYAVEVGIERTSMLANNYESGRAVLLARENYGFTDNVTAGYRMEGESGLLNASSSVSLALPLGFLSAGLAGSDASGARGYGSSVAYQYVSRYVSAGSAIQMFSGTYRRIGDDLLPPAFRPRRVAYADATWTPGSTLSLHVSAGSMVYADATRQQNFGVNASLNLPGGKILMLNVDRQINHPGSNDNQVSVNLVVPVGKGSVGANAVHDAATGNSYGVSAQRSVPSDSGWGYSVNAQNGAQGTSSIDQVEYQGRYGLVQVGGQRFAGQSSGNALLSGSFVALDDHIYAGRPLQNGYALIETSGRPDIGVTHENQLIGRTDADGNLLVTNLQPYQANKVGIDQGMVPLQDQIDATDQVISTPRLGGTVVRFGIHALHAARGVLMLDGKAVQFGSATLMIEDAPMKTLIGLDGSFYISDLPPGGYLLQAETLQGRMRCAITMPREARPLTDLGKITCTRGEGP